MFNITNKSDTYTCNFGTRLSHKTVTPSYANKVFITNQSNVRQIILQEF